MALTDNITFVVPVVDRKVLERNVLASPPMRANHRHQLLIQEGFASAASAYNDALMRSVNDLIVFMHSDVFLPEGWIPQLEHSLRWLEKHDPGWGVLGCWGATRGGEYRGHLYSTGWGVLGKASDKPEQVQTLDEVVLIFRKSSGLRFDDHLPHFHFYGTDICMRAAKRGLGSYAISAFCVHNTSQLLRLPKEFYACYSYIRRTWKSSLPIQTSCIRVTRFNGEVYQRKFKEACGHILGRDTLPERRADDPARILQEIAVA